jgi:outer membrane protein TolC
MRAGYEKAVLTALIETENTLVLFSRELESRDSLISAVQTGRQAVQLSEGLYKSGLTDLIDVLSNQRIQYQAEDQLIQSEQQLALTTIALYKALGGGWEIAEQSASADPVNSRANQKNQELHGRQ